MRGYDTGELATCRRFLEMAVELRSWVSLPFRVSRRVFAFAERGEACTQPCAMAGVACRGCQLMHHRLLLEQWLACCATLYAPVWEHMHGGHQPAILPAGPHPA